MRRSNDSSLGRGFGLASKRHFCARFVLDNEVISLYSEQHSLEPWTGGTAVRFFKCSLLAEVSHDEALIFASSSETSASRELQVNHLKRFVI